MKIEKLLPLMAKMAFSMLLVLLWYNPASAQENSMYAVDDAVVSANYPDSIIDQSEIGGNIRMFKERVGDDLLSTYSFIKFDIGHLKGTQLTEASLSYRGKTGDADFEDEFLVDLYGLKADFYGDTTTWNNKPGKGSKLGTSYLNGDSGRKGFENDGSKLIDYINEEIRKGSMIIGFMISSSGKDTTTNMWTGGSANGNYGPILDYTISPENSHYAIDDAVVSANYPDSIIDQSEIGGNIRMFKERVGDDLLATYSFVKFDIGHLKGTQLTEASLSYRGKTGDADFEDEFLVDLYGLKADFYGDTTTWDNKPGKGSKLGTSFLNGDSGRKGFENDGSKLIDYINEEIRKGSMTIGFMISSSGKDTTTNMWTGGSANGNYGPILDYTISPENSHYAIDDAVVSANYPDSIIDQSEIGGNIRMFKERVGDDLLATYSFVKFDISHLKGSQLTDASLSYRGKTGDADFEDEFLVDLYGLKADFYGDTTTWNNKPGKGSKLGTSFLNGDSGRKGFENDGSKLIDYINEEIRKGSMTIGFMISSSEKDTTTNMWTGGSANGNYGPILDYTISHENSQYAIDDAVVSANYPDSIIDQSEIGGNIRMFKERVGDDLLATYSFVKFDISHLKGTQLTDASLSYRGKTGDADFEDEFLVDLYGLKADFYGDTTTWNNKPGKGSKLGTSFLNGDSGRKGFENDGSKLIDYINEEIRKGSMTIGFMISSTGKDTTTNMWTGGSANGNYGPILEFSKGSIFTPADDSLQVIADAFVMEAFPDSVNGAAADMHVLKKDGDNREMYLKFDITDKKKLAGDVELKLYIAQHNSGTEEEEYYIEILPTGNAWSEDTLTWNNRVLPEDKVLLEANIDNFNTGMYHYLSGDEFTNYVNTAILEGAQDSLTFLVRARDAKTGRLWSAGKEWKNESWLIFKYATPAPKQKIGVIDDAYVAEATPDDNFGAEADMHIIKEAGTEKEVYLRFDLSEVRAGEAINASLDIYIGQHNSGAGLDDYYVDVVGVKNEWSEDSLTWNNKPETNSDPLVMGNVKNFGGGEYRMWTSEDFTAYVNKAIKEKKDYLSLVIRSKDETPGNRLWTAGKEWKNSASLVLSYDPVVATPKVTPEEGDYIDSINVQLTTTTDGATIYYTLDGTEPSDSASMYDSGAGIPLMVSDYDSTFTLKVIGMADGLNPSLVVTKQFNISPVSVPVFSPNPLVEYTDQVTVTLSAEPASALIFYSDVKGEEPTTPYPAEGIIISATTTIKAVAVNTSGKFTSAAAEATFKVVTTVAGTGTGPGGVGAADNTISGQPENALWLKADAITANDGDAVLQWDDASGNENHAYNSFEEGGDNKIPNTIESQQPAPTFVAAGLNSLPVLDFGKPEDGDARVRSLVVDDADNLDGGAGISLFMVFKRNEMLADFASIFQKRNLSGDATDQAYVVEFDGGSNPHRLQFVIARDLFLKQNIDEVNDQDYYVINVEVQGDFQQALFRTNGELLSTQTYKNIIQAVDAPAILGGFQPMNIAEVIMYKKGLNAAQNKIVHNYLASKWGLELKEGIVYNDSVYTSDVVGVGKDTYIDDTTEQEHKSASGGGLSIEMANTFATGNFVFAGHNGLGVTNAEGWERTWNVSPTAEALNVKMGFDFEAVGLTAPTSADGYKLWKDTGDGFEDTGLTGTLDGNVISFTVEGIGAGVYGIGTSKPSAIAAPKFSVPGGEYDTEQSVEMTTTTDGAKIFFTTDGSTPTSASTEYTGAITISETTDLKAVAILDGESSGVTEATYTIGATGIDYNDISNALIVYPNPASELVKIHFENKDLGAVQLRLMDYSGKTLMQSKADKQTEVLEFALPMSKLTNGLYFIEIIQGTQRAVKHIIKQ